LSGQFVFALLSKNNLILGLKHGDYESFIKSLHIGMVFQIPLNLL